MKFQGKKDIVKEVQAEIGLSPDGVDGPKTWKMIWETMINDGKAKEKKAAISAYENKDSSANLKEDYPEEYKASPNQSGNIRPKYIVLHHSSGSHDGTKSWILNRNSKVSYHYLIASDGSRTQFVYDNRKAWHAGKSIWKACFGLNSSSVSISFYGNTHERHVSDVEIDSAAKKCIYLMDKFDIGVAGILTHKMIAPKRKDDPSDNTYERVLFRISELTK
ncbi:N-acetylmuramoyl-L-alanine amidase [bacterium]|nr:N-acetylmuramoyl-L-alanine amidase [bacterium]